MLKAPFVLEIFKFFPYFLEQLLLEQQEIFQIKFLKIELIKLLEIVVMMYIKEP